MDKSNNNSQNNVYFSDYLKNGKKKRTIKDVLLFLLPVIGICFVIAIIALFALNFKGRKASTHSSIENAVVSDNNGVNLNDNYSNVAIITTSYAKAEITTVTTTSNVHTQAITTEQIIKEPTGFQKMI